MEDESRIGAAKSEGGGEGVMRIMERTVFAKRGDWEVVRLRFKTCAFDGELPFEHEQREDRFNGSSRSKCMACKGFGGHERDGFAENTCENMRFNCVVGFCSRAMGVDESDVFWLQFRFRKCLLYGTFQIFSLWFWLSDVERVCPFTETADGERRICFGTFCHDDNACGFA